MDNKTGSTLSAQQIHELTDKIKTYIKNRETIQIEKFDKSTAKQLSTVATGSPEAEALSKQLEEKRQNILEKFQPNNWLSDASTRAKQIRFVTHALKFSHTDAKGSSFYSRQHSTDNSFHHQYLSSSSLCSPPTDVVGNAAALDVANFLKLQAAGVSLLTLIAENNGIALQAFAHNDEQLTQWLAGFGEVLHDGETSSHKLAKQLYFPTDADHYHVISPLYASSLSQQLYQHIADSRFSESAKAARKAKKTNAFSEQMVVEFPHTAVQTFGGTKPQNVSLLNSQRGGKSFLLNSQPPRWNTQHLRLPVNSKYAFWREYDRRAWSTAKILRDFLCRALDKESRKPLRDYRAELVDRLIDILLHYASQLQSLSDHAGWSAQSKLPPAEQAWLDPQRNTPELNQLRDSKSWQQEIATSFARWLNHKLSKSGKLPLGDTEYQQWSTLLERKLMLLRQDMEMLSV